MRHTRIIQREKQSGSRAVIREVVYPYSLSSTLNKLKKIKGGANDFYYDLLKYGKTRLAVDNFTVDYFAEEFDPSEVATWKKKFARLARRLGFMVL